MSTKSTGTAAVYLRISSDPDGERAGVERQRTECLELADRLGLEVVEVIEDNDTSAYSGKPRPGFEVLLANAAAGDYSAVIVWSADRLYRRLADLVRITEALKPHSVPVHSVTGGRIDLTTAEGRLQANTLGAVAAYESEHKADRVAARARQRAAQGRMTASNRPRGWRWVDPCPGGTACHHASPHDLGERPRKGSRAGLVLDPIEAPMIAEAYRRVAEGHTLRGVYRWLHAQGLPLGRADSLRGILLSPRNAGLVSHHGEVVAEAADGLALIDRDTFDRVSAILRDPARRMSTGRPVATPLGGGLLVCPRCGGNMAASTRTRSGGRKHGVYICSRHQHYSRPRSHFDALVLDYAGAVLGELAAAGVLGTATAEADTASAALRADIATAEARLETLAALVAAGDLDPADYAKASRKIRADLDGLTARLTRRAGRPALAALAADTDGVAAAYARLRARCEDGDAEPLRAVLGELLARVTPAAGGAALVEFADGLGPAEPVTLEPPEPPRLGREDRRELVARLFADGLNVGQIADRVGCYRGTVRGDLDALGLRQPGRLVGRSAHKCRRRKRAAA